MPRSIGQHQGIQAVRFLHWFYVVLALATGFAVYQWADTGDPVLARRGGGHRSAPHRCAGRSDYGVPEPAVTKGLETFGDALAAALMQIERIDPAHQVNEIRFGTFADHVGGGKYYAVSVSYALGNTVGAQRPSRQDPEYRIRMAIQAFEAAFAEENQS